MTQKSEFGAKGESAGCLFLTKKGYRIIERNARKPWGELDIVAKGPDGTLVFVEVKTMHEGALMPEDQMTAGKMGKFRRTASLYAGAHPTLVSNGTGFRLDVLAITKQNGGYDIRHYENI